MKPGVALPIVLLVLALTSAMVVSGAFVARRQVAVSRDLESKSQLEAAAEQAAVAAVADWDSAARADQPIGSAVSLTSVLEPGARSDAWITRIGPRMYWVVAESQSDARPPQPTLRRRIGLLVRVVSGVPTLTPERPWTDLP